LIKNNNNNNVELMEEIGRLYHKERDLPVSEAARDSAKGK